MTFCQDVTVSESEAARNKLSGIHCAECHQVTLDGNLCEGNDEDGIFIEKQMNSCTGMTVRNNTVQNNRRLGINASTATTPTIEGNKSLHNGQTTL